MFTTCEATFKYKVELLLRYEGLKRINQDNHFPVPLRAALGKDSLKAMLETSHESILCPGVELGYEVGRQEHLSVYILAYMFTLIFFLKKT